jgi:3-hydroxymyristoyl/3-hydroxydecanoyl-(acyl carrier protein) dehydratase
MAPVADLQLTLQIPLEHPSYAGHFPGQPIVPGVMLLDKVMLSIEQQLPSFGLFSSAGAEIPVCKFLAPVLPGATLSLMLHWEGPGSLLTFKLQHAAQLVASGSIRPAATP